MSDKHKRYAGLNVIEPEEGYEYRWEYTKRRRLARLLAKGCLAVAVTLAPDLVREAGVELDERALR